MSAPTKEEHMVARYLAGAPIREVAAEAGLTYQQARLALLRHGVKLRGRGGNTRKRGGAA